MIIDAFWKTLPSAATDNSQRYWLLDGSADPLIHAHIEADDDISACPLLNRTDMPLAYSPWLVKMDKDTLFTQWISEQGLMAHWGIILGSALPLHTLKEHLIEYLHVFDEEAQMPAIMRFYDPRFFYAFTQFIGPAGQQDFFALLEFVGGAAPYKTDTLRYYTAHDDGVTFVERSLLPPEPANESDKGSVDTSVSHSTNSTPTTKGATHANAK